MLANERDSQWEIAFRKHHHCVVTSFRGGGCSTKRFWIQINLVGGKCCWWWRWRPWWCWRSGQPGSRKGEVSGAHRGEVLRSNHCDHVLHKQHHNFWLWMPWGLSHESVVVVLGQHYIILNLICYNHTFSVQFCNSQFLSVHNVKYIILTFKQIFHTNSIL